MDSKNNPDEKIRDFDKKVIELLVNVAVSMISAVAVLSLAGVL